MNTAVQLLRTTGGRARDRLYRLLTAAGLAESESKIANDAQHYWNDSSTERWGADSHWRDSTPFRDSDLWSAIGRRHLLMLERGTRALESNNSWNRILEWGCGGGANAVHFAPRAQEFIGVEVSAATLDECARQTAAACDTPFQPVLVDVADPEGALREVREPVDIFLCFYVFELLPTPEYGARILRIAEQLLAPGGIALIQIKYDDGRWTSKPRRRDYRTGVAAMTSYPIAAFWQLAADCGLRPVSVELVPRDELDERYAYFVLRRPTEADSVAPPLAQAG